MQKKRLILIIFVLAAVALVLYLVATPAANETDRIYTNIYIHDVPVGGLTITEAEAALMERFQHGLDGRLITYVANGQIVGEFTFADFGASFNFSQLVNTAMEYSTTGNLQSRVRRMFGHAYKINTPPELTISPQRMESILTGLARLINIPAQNATFALENEQIVIMQESIGHSINMEAAALATHQVLHSLDSGVVELIQEIVQPKYTKADFDFDLSVLGSFQTRYTGTESDPRVFNVALAADKINNHVLFPGETFSAGEMIGAHKPNSGYKTAIVLVQGEPVEDVGGGVCQVVTTLYNAVLVAELAIVQRHNHSAPVSYVESGFDATVAGDYYDLKFSNNTPHPILIITQMTGGNLRISIYGYETRPANRNIRFNATRVEVIRPEPYREILDPTLPIGERYITLESQLGYHIELHKHIYIDGQEVEVVKINTSIYKPLQGVIAIGAG